MKVRCFIKLDETIQVKMSSKDLSFFNEIEDMMVAELEKKKLI
jgi:hypothetical protein